MFRLRLRAHEDIKTAPTKLIKNLGSAGTQAQAPLEHLFYKLIDAPCCAPYDLIIHSWKICRVKALYLILHQPLLELYYTLFSTACSALV